MPEPEARDERNVLPPITPIEELDVGEDPLDLLTEEERRSLLEALDTMARVRRNAEASSRELRLS
jgi:hypothetical protein